MVLCCAFKCPNRTDRIGQFKKDAYENPISYHRFPKDPELREQWINAIGRHNWLPREKSVLCSVHFTPDCFNRTLSVTRLRSNAVPTIFPWSSYLKQRPLREIRSRSELELPIVMEEKLSEIVEDPLATTSSLGLEETRNKPKIELIIVKEEASEIEIVEEPIDLQPSSSSGINEPIRLNHKEMISRGTSPIREYWSELPIVTQMRDAYKSQITDYRKKIKVLQQTVRKQKKKITDMESVLKSVKSDMLLLEENVLILNNVCGPNELLNKQLLKVKKHFPKKL